MSSLNSKYSNLTKSQLSLWTSQKLHPNVPLNNVVHTFEISGPIKRDVFEAAFKRLIKETDVLRSVFSEIDGIPYQSFQQSFEFELEMIDVYSSKIDIALDDWILNRAQNVLDISKRVFDTALLKIEDDKYIWFLNMHHLITDGVTTSILYDRMSSNYSALLKGSLEILEPSPPFEDYIAFEINEQTNTNNDSNRSFWKEHLNGIEDVPKLYGTNTNGSNTKIDRYKIPIGKQLSEQLKEFALQADFRGWTEQATIFNILATVFYVFLNRVSNQKKIAIGTTTHNRTTKNFRKTPGYFIEVFPLLNVLQDEDTFLTLYQRVKSSMNTFLKNVKPGIFEPNMGRSTNVILNYITTKFNDFNGFPTKSEWIYTGHMSSANQMIFHIADFDDSGEFEFIFDINTSILSNERRKTIPDQFLRLLKAFLENFNQSIFRPSLVGYEKNDAVFSIGKIKTIDKLTILDHFENQVAKSPENIALVHNAQVLTYDDLNIRINQFAHFLIAQGIGTESRVCILLKRSTEYVISVLAVLKTGATFIPISSDQPSERIKFILSDANCSLLITNSELAEQIRGSSTPIISLENNQYEIDQMSRIGLNISIQKEDLAYILYTSGSTGNPKGVLISHGSLVNYLSWANSFYKADESFVFPLFTSIGFDLTITSTFLPLITGGELIIYKESSHGPDISLMEVLEENKVNSIKLTPSHLALIQGNDNSTSHIKTMIVGGEDFKTKIATNIQESFGEDLRIFNEYGPTESTVGCMVSRFDKTKHTETSVPIGLPINGVQAYIFDDHMNLVPEGVIGSLFIGGVGLAEGYLNLAELTTEKFAQNPFNSGEKLYQTGDLARINSDGEYEYLGRVDEQIKLRGFRIELTDIEANLLKHESVENTAVVVIENEKAIPENEVINCSECGLPSNYPNTDFDENGVCHVCNAFKGYKEQAQKYFKTEDELRKLLISKRGLGPNYDCISLLSGGKDSTYILAQLINMGLKVLAFTLDNGYISDQAKGNIDRIVSKLNVDHIYGSTEHMNKIFIDSLHRHQNVCNGCFKTIYTLATQIALEKQVPFVVTGLSRGQFFETRLTEELFWDENADVAKIDDTILEARKLYHQEEDAVKNLMDVSAFNNDETFKKVQFVDFYRYSDVSLEEMLVFLKEKVDWVRPTDTGRSTNCTINQLGIYVHKKEKGYSNYSFPYSWDVRMGHKTRTETLEEINEVIDEVEVKRIMQEIGYIESSESELEQNRLVGYYTGKQKLSSIKLTNHLKKELPAHMIPTHFKYIKELPLTANGKVDKSALKTLNNSQLDMETPFVAPEGEIEELLASIWKEVLRLKQVGIHDDFIALGGHSLAAIRVTARINEEIELNFQLNKIFEFPTIKEYSDLIEETLTKLLNE